jgi:small conductance mechanosensitive channel
MTPDFLTQVELGRMAAIAGLGVLLMVALRVGLRVLRARLVAGELDTEREKRALTLIRAARRFLTVVIVLVVVLMLLAEFGVPMAPLLGAAGVVGIAAGLGAQHLAKDLVRGFSLLLDNAIRVGDYIEVLGRSGTVEEVTLRRVVLRDYEGAVHFVPTGAIESLTNHSFGFSYALIEVPLSADDDVSRAIECMCDCAATMRRRPAETDRVLGELEVSGIEHWNPDSITVRARIRVAPGAHAVVRRALLLDIRRRLTAEGLAIQEHRLVVRRARQDG